MFNFVQKWFARYFTDPQAIILFFLLVFGFAIVLTMGEMLGPVFVALIFAYLLEGIINKCTRLRIPRILTVNIVFVVFMGASLFLFVTLLPLLWQQMKQFFNDLPVIFERGEALFSLLTQKFPEYITKEQAAELTRNLQDQIAHYAQYALQSTITSLPGVIVLLVYLILVPLLMFFFMKDKTKILQWLSKYLPEERHAANRVWVEMNEQIGNYVRGKVVEIIIVGVVTYITFFLLGLKYAAILGLVTGFSVLIPYIGASVVTLPVALVAFFQWGWSPQFAYIMIAYGIIQALDGNLLVPLLFSEAVNLHPVAIIIAVLVFGGIWGFWGIFFAIPLATLVKAVLNAWPVYNEIQTNQPPI